MIKENSSCFFGREVTDRDRATFEAGIKLGALYHQFVGVPFREQVSPIIERAIEAAISCQPYVEHVEVRIKPHSNDLNKYGYSEVNGRNLSVKLTVKYNNVRVTASMKFIPELNYPLMFIEKIEEDK